MIGMQSDFCIRTTCSAVPWRENEILLVRGVHATYGRIQYHSHGMITPAVDIEREIEGKLEEAGVIMLDTKDVPGMFTHPTRCIVVRRGGRELAEHILLETLPERLSCEVLTMGGLQVFLSGLLVPGLHQQCL